MSDQNEPSARPGSARPGSAQQHGAQQPYPRRRFLQQAGAAGLTVPLAGTAAGALTRTATSSRRRFTAATPIEHIIVCCQENHSFDHYFGSYSKLPPGYGIPSGFTQPNGLGGTVAPFHFTSLNDNSKDPNHTWPHIRAEYNDGAMDGFYTTDGIESMGYYNETDLPYYYSLFRKHTLCANYFCGVLSDTYPNRLVLYAGTSGGITTDNIEKGSLTYPCVLDLLSGGGITFNNYNFHCAENYSLLALFEEWATGGPNNELNLTKADFFDDCANNTLPQVAFITSPPPYDEHPPAGIHVGQSMIKSIVTAVQESEAWSSTAILITYDEGGGFFDHIAPQQLDAFGPGIRVPMTIVSPYANVGYVDTTFSDHGSVLKFIETVFGLPTLASINHEFDDSTPTGPNYQADGAPFPPRDGNPALSDLTQCFTFG